MGLLSTEEAGRRIREARVARGLTQGEFGTLVGRAQSLVCSWELGIRPVGRDDLPLVCKVLKLELHELLLEGDEDRAAEAER